MSSTKEKIITTAQKFFARFGLEKTTVDEIAKAAHVAKGTIYHYFQSKEEIFEAVVNKEKLIVEAALKKCIDAVQSPQDKLKAYITTRVQHVRELLNFYSALKDDYLKHYESINKIRKKLDEEEITIIGNILEYGCKQGIFAVQDIRLTAIAMVTAFRSMETPLVFTPPMNDIEHALDVLLNMMFKGLEKR